MVGLRSIRQADAQGRLRGCGLYVRCGMHVMRSASDAGHRLATMGSCTLESGSTALMGRLEPWAECRSQRPTNMFCSAPQSHAEDAQARDGKSAKLSDVGGSGPRVRDALELLQATG